MDGSCQCAGADCLHRARSHFIFRLFLVACRLFSLSSRIQQSCLGLYVRHISVLHRSVPCPPVVHTGASFLLRSRTEAHNFLTDAHNACTETRVDAHAAMHTYIHKQRCLAKDSVRCAVPPPLLPFRTCVCVVPLPLTSPRLLPPPAQGKYMGRVGSFTPIIHIGLAAGFLGYALEYSHLAAHERAYKSH